MTISFEEITGEVVPDRRRERGGDDERPGGASERALDDRIQAALARERHRAERLSDR